MCCNYVCLPRSCHPLLEAITDLNGAIPQDMIIDSLLLDVSTVIGQGLSANFDQHCLEFTANFAQYSGEFGVVYKGMLKKGAVNQVVAVKSLKGGVRPLTLACKVVQGAKEV